MDGSATEEWKGGTGRRRFLKTMAGLAGISAGSKAAGWINRAQSNPEEVIMGAIESEKGMDTLLYLGEVKYEMQAKGLAKKEGWSLEANPEKRSVLASIKDAVAWYEGNGGKVSYGFAEERKSGDYFLNAVRESEAYKHWKEIAKRGWEIFEGGEFLGDVATAMSDMRYVMEQAMSLREMFILRLAIEDFVHPVDCLVPGSGYMRRGLERLRKAGAPLVVDEAYLLGKLDQHRVVDFGELIGTMTGEGVNAFDVLTISRQVDLEEARAFLTTKALELGGRIPSADLLRFRLAKDEGRLEEALMDWAIDLKMMARNDLVSGSHVGGLPEWSEKLYLERMRYLRDEFSVVGNYHNGVSERNGVINPGELGWDYKSRDLSRLNIWGGLYHRAWQVALGATFPAIFIKWMVVGQMLPFIDGPQGRVKAASNFSVAMEQDEIQRYFRAWLRKN